MPPAYVVQHTYLGEAIQMHHRRPVVMMANRFDDETREADCSGRALATLVVAWVGAALVASVLLKWTHMWVALAVLTLLFLAACGYAACDARRTQERAFAREAERQEERRRRREQQLESVSGGIDNYPEIIDPPEYQTYWVPDLPPSYTAVVSTQTVNAGGTTRTPGVPDAEETSSVSPPRLSNPPPYAIAVQSEPLFLPIVQTGHQNDGTPEVQGVLPPGQNVILQSSVENGQTSSHNGRMVGTPLPAVVGAQDKVEEGEENGQNTVTTQPTRTQYLTSILNSTFGRNMRRANNAEQSFNPPGVHTYADRLSAEAQNNRNRDQSLVHNSNNNDRNISNNHGSGPPPQYPVTRLSTGY